VDPEQHGGVGRFGEEAVNVVPERELEAKGHPPGPPPTPQGR
jgi:hypothetical protein